MKQLALILVTAVAFLSAAVVLLDWLMAAYGSLRRRRKAKRGAVGVVIDRAGTTLGIYLDPFGDPARRARLHEGNSPWTNAGPEGPRWAWEGIGLTAEEARRAAHRLRRRHLQLLPQLNGMDEDEGDFASFQAPIAPSWL